MVRAWYLCEIPEGGDPNEPHMQDPPHFLDTDQLKAQTAVEYQSFDADSHETSEAYAKLKSDLGLTHEDVLDISTETSSEKLAAFFAEHMHTDEEVRFCVSGGGYFDVRDGDDKWIRVEIAKNDLLLLPAGLYHRFTLGPQTSVQLKRLFTETPTWAAINRPEADDHPQRLEYVRKMINAA